MSHSKLQPLIDACAMTDTIEVYSLVLVEREEGAAISPLPPEQLNRVRGMPVGVDDARWPKDDDDDGRRWAHVLTLDLATMPTLAAAIPGYRAAAFFVRDPDGSLAYSGPELTMQWVWLTEEDIHRGVVAKDDAPQWGDAPGPGEAFRVETYQVPRAVFEPRTEHEDSDDEYEQQQDRLDQLRNAIMNLPGRAGGGAVPIQSEPYLPDDPFFVQVDSYFTGLNLGDCGCAYISRKEGLWDCG